MNNPKLIFYNGLKLNEAMYWDKKNKLLYFVAIRYNLIYELDPRSGSVKTYKTDGPVGGAVVDTDGNIVEAEKSGIYKIDSKTGEKTFIAHFLPYDKMRYNHLILDSRGRILVDVMGDEERHAGDGGLYLYDGTSHRCLIAGTTVANGVVLSENETKLYFTDTVTKTVQEYDYDINTGNVSNGRTIITMPENEDGKPDGLMLGKNNTMWIAEWDSGKFSRWSIETGKKLYDIEFPAAHVTSSCVGGDDDEYIFVATAKREETDNAPSGGIFRIDNE